MKTISKFTELIEEIEAREFIQFVKDNAAEIGFAEASAILLELGESL